MKANSGIDPVDMLFFDDLWKNVKAANELGTTAVKVNPDVGLTEEAFARGCALWRAQHKAKRAEARSTARSAAMMANYFQQKPSMKPSAAVSSS